MCPAGCEPTTLSFVIIVTQTAINADGERIARTWTLASWLPGINGLFVKGGSGPTNIGAYVDLDASPAPGQATGLVIGSAPPASFLTAGALSGLFDVRDFPATGPGRNPFQEFSDIIGFYVTPLPAGVLMLIPALAGLLGWNWKRIVVAAQPQPQAA